MHRLLQKLLVLDLAEATCTVKPALSNHPTVQEKVVVIDRWSLKQGSLNSGRFSKLCWTVANVVVRMRTINATISHVDRVQAVAPASCGGSLANLRCGGCFKRECGVKARIFLAFGGRENPAVGAKNPGRWSRYAGGRLIQVILNGRLSMHEKSVANSRWSLKAGCTVQLQGDCGAEGWF